MIKIRPEKGMLVLNGRIPSAVETALQAEYMWVSIEALDEPIYLYADGLTYQGLLYDVADFIGDLGYPAEIELPELPPKQYPHWQFTGALRPLQPEAVAALKQDRFGGLEAPPGFGKTVAIAALTAQLGYQTAILVQQQEPFMQAIEAFQQFTNVGFIGQIGGKSKAKKYRTPGDVSVCMIQTLAKALLNEPDGVLAKWFRQCRVVICDEYHHGAADSYLTAIQALRDPYYVIGVSATPEDRQDGLQTFVDAFFGRPRHVVTYGEAIDAGFLCPITVYMEQITPRDFGFTGKVDGKANRRKFYSQRQKASAFEEVKQQYIIYNEERNQKAIWFAQDMVAANESVAMIVDRIEHAKVLKKLWPEIVILDATTKERTQIIEQLRKKEVMCVATTLFDEATNIPSLGCVALLAGGKSAIKLKQRLRCTRAFEGMTAKGPMKKTRGYVWYPMDRADYVKSHSEANERLLREIVREHPKNRLEIITQDA